MLIMVKRYLSEFQSSEKSSENYHFLLLKGENNLVLSDKHKLCSILRAILPSTIDKEFNEL